ncbi:tetratricopeptide repeat protein [Clostridium sp.]|uniref:tetratricopeptide repeat protein n=1 Tax=Clostridium sp. TaxID=1506 RepID=UPI0039F452E2
MKNIDKALNINPNYGYGRFNKALAYELYGHYDEALSWYDKALEVEKYVWSYYGKASIYGRRGDVANTVKYLKIAIDMQESVKEEAKKEKDFDNVRNSKEFMELVK